MAIINIKSLDKDEVILALLLNVYMKTRASQIAHDAIVHYSPDELGAYSKPTLEEVRQFTSEHGYDIEYIACVCLNIDFSADEIDTKYYDSLHKTAKGDGGALSAKACIAALTAREESVNPARKSVSDIVLVGGESKVGRINVTTIIAAGDGTPQKVIIASGGARVGEITHQTLWAPQPAAVVITEADEEPESESIYLSDQYIQSYH